MNDVASQIIEAMDNQRTAFGSDVRAGLSANPKTLPSRWLYDDRGSELFEEITSLPEYYPTRTETVILSENASELADFCGSEAVVIEYGAGASVKSEILLSALEQPRLYVPIDIAGDFLAQAADRLRRRFPSLAIYPVAADFTSDFVFPADLPSDNVRTAFFPGSTIGNLAPEEARAFLRRIRGHVATMEPRSKPGRAIIGIDLRKSTDVLLPAYNDAAGVTAAFNLNILRRINRELDGDFELEAYHHEARWNDGQSAVEMHIISGADQTVTVAGERYEIAAGETIHTESSRKYTIDGFTALAAEVGWRLTSHWTDERELFAVVGLETAAI